MYVILAEISAAIITLFVILDPVGVLPFFIGLTHNISVQQRKRLANRAVMIATMLLLVFAFLGDLILLFLGIKIADMEIAGGALLLIFALRDALSNEPLGAVESEDVQDRAKRIEVMTVIPIATPLLAGPGSLTTVMLFTREPDGVFVAIAAIVVDCLIAWILLHLGDKITRKLGPTVLLIVAKVMDILMAAIAVSFLTSGLTSIFGL